MRKKIRLAIFASGAGTNTEAIITYFQGHQQIEVALVLSNNPDAYVLQRATKFNVPIKVFTKTQLREDGQVLRWLQEAQITHLVLAGFLWLLPESLIQVFEDRIINIHPSLLPEFGGKGMYGMNVHRAVKMACAQETGITIHLVNGRYDEGRVMLRVSCKVMPSDSLEDIAGKVNQLEYAYYPKTIEQWTLS